MALVLSPLIVTDDHDSVVLTPVGDLDMATGPAFVAEVRCVLSTSPKRMVFDLGSLAFLDSSGCRALLLGLREARASGVHVGLQGDMAPIVQLVVDITLLDSIFDPA
jgi:anti-anti-sigma factor